MSTPFFVSLKAGQRLYVNGAVLRVDRRVGLEFLNDVTFLLDHHVMRLDQATTPLRQLYFLVQTLLIAPSETSTRGLFAASYDAVIRVIDASDLRSGLCEVRRLVDMGRPFEALKVLRTLFAIEDRILPSPSPAGVYETHLEGFRHGSS